MSSERFAGAFKHEVGEPQQPMMIAGGGGTRIAAYEYGDANGLEILLVHGFSQSHLAWASQYKSPTLQQFRIVVIDLRGHGASEKPTDVGSYNDSRVWAQDIHRRARAVALGVSNAGARVNHPPQFLTDVPIASEDGTGASQRGGLTTGAGGARHKRQAAELLADFTGSGGVEP
jgi:hypothetical protein